MQPANERVPSIKRMLWRGFTGRCPACAKPAIGRFWVQPVVQCRRCGLRFERIEGHFIGAIGINTIVSFGVLLIALVTGLVLTFPDFPVGRLVIGNLAVAIGVPILFLPSSRMLWTAIDITMRPLEPHEVDWIQVYASIGRGALDGDRPSP